jgi:hypothetical protein
MRERCAPGASARIRSLRTQDGFEAMTSRGKNRDRYGSRLVQHPVQLLARRGGERGNGPMAMPPPSWTRLELYI